MDGVKHHFRVEDTMQDDGRAGMESGHSLDIETAHVEHG